MSKSSVTLAGVYKTDSRRRCWLTRAGEAGFLPILAGKSSILWLYPVTMIHYADSINSYIIIMWHLWIRLRKCRIMKMARHARTHMCKGARTLSLSLSLSLSLYIYIYIYIYIYNTLYSVVKELSVVFRTYQIIQYCFMISIYLEWMFGYDSYYKYKNHCDSGSLDCHAYLKRSLRAPP